MNRLALLLVIVGVVFFLVAPVVVAQEPGADDYIELFKPLVGTWKTTTTVGGKAMEGTYWCRLSRTNKCFVSYGEGGTLPASETLQGYDPVAKQWTLSAYDADGGYCLTALTIKDMKKGKALGLDYCATSESVRHSQDGKKITGSDTVKITAYGQDRIEALVTDRKEDGQLQPDIKFVMERQPDQRRRPEARPAASAPESQDVTANDYIEFWKPLVGSWKTEFETGGARIEGTSRVRLSRNNRCLVTYAEAEGQPSTQGIEGYDPGTKKWRRVSFDSDGGCGVITVEFTDMKKGKRLEKGVIGKIELTNSTKDDKTSTEADVMACIEFSENRIVFTGSDGEQAEQQVPVVTLTLERQPERERRAKQ
jgi:hypothetical protein